MRNRDAINNLSGTVPPAGAPPEAWANETAPVQSWRFDHRYPGDRLDSDCVDGNISFRRPFSQLLPRTLDLALGEFTQRFGSTGKPGGRVCRE